VYPLNTVLVGAYPLYTVNTPYSLNTYLEGPANQHLIIENQYFSNAERHLGNADRILVFQQCKPAFN
jgi:hypothetical protein